MIEIDIEKALNGASGRLDLAFNCRLEVGQFLAIFGESGAGKTSILRMICGLMKPDRGIIKLGSKTYYDSTRKINLSPQSRDVGIVFQNYALFPNMNVRQQLEFALPKDEDPSKIDEYTDLMGLDQLSFLRPKELSGGQRQRLALARTLVQGPSLLLLDEPLAAVGQSMRTQLQEELKKVHKTLGLSTILVSHDSKEVLNLADHVIKLKDGKVVEEGRPLDLLFTQSREEVQVISVQVEEVILENDRRFARVLINEKVCKIDINDHVPAVSKGDQISINIRSLKKSN